jgi:hypothetical protein
MKKFFSPKSDFTQTETYTNDFVRERSINPSRNVDINKLLNRIKINKKNELKRKLFFICGSSSALVLFSIFIISLK